MTGRVLAQRYGDLLAGDYTQVNRDRIWLCLSFDTWSTPGDYPFPNMYGHPIYPTVGGRISYELLDGECAFTNRRDAEAYRDLLDSWFPKYEGDWYVVNLGDMDRFDNAYLDHGVLLRKGKFVGSTAALNRRADFWLERLATQIDAIEDYANEERP